MIFRELRDLFVGSIPSEFGNLKSLTELYLCRNKLIGLEILWHFVLNDSDVVHTDDVKCK